MPGQRRRREREAARRRARERREGEGRWAVLFETDDPEVFRAYRNGEEVARLADDDLRIDVLCGRGENPTWYRISGLVPHADG
ncbi:hypothetical protein [Nocardiopsis sp. FIRDI 009]|uniref:hypothetical protein n=1 Tax=Nocardiopsis sp. FIRDI 009 TaxID=714197 RepID=UPI0013003B96|nr:hypothetical protein [Nocardiopsis sp. FIRDI 009]